MLTSSKPTKRKTSSLAAATSMAPALTMSSEPKNSPARSSPGSACASDTSTSPIKIKTIRELYDSASFKATAEWGSVWLSFKVQSTRSASTKAPALHAHQNRRGLLMKAEAVMIAMAANKSSISGRRISVDPRTTSMAL